MPCTNCKQCGHNVKTCPVLVTRIPKAKKVKRSKRKPTDLHNHAVTITLVARCFGVELPVEFREMISVLATPTLPYLANLLAPHRKSVWSKRRPEGVKHTYQGQYLHEKSLNRPSKCSRHLSVYGFPIYMDAFCAPKGHPQTGKSPPTFTYLNRPIGGFKNCPSRTGLAQDSLYMNSFMAYGDRVVFCTPLEVAQIRLAFSKIRTLDMDVLERLVELISTRACRSVSYAFEPILDEVREKLCLENLIKMC
jgi:hypothetical protein